MDIDFLKTYLAVCRTRHFGQAADSLCVSQSTVSARIRLLEERIGAPVFTRERNNIQLTLTGQRLLPYAQSVVTTWNRARQELLAEGDTTLLSIGGVPSLWDIRLQSWLHAVCEHVPPLSVNAEVLGGDVLVRRLLDLTLDLGFSYEPSLSAPVQTQQVFSVPLIMVASRPGLSAAQALGEDYIWVDWGASFSTEHARVFEQIPPPRIRLALGRMAKALLLKRGGAAYLAEATVTQALAQGRLWRVQDAPVITRAAYALYCPSGEKHALIASLLALFSMPPAVD